MIELNNDNLLYFIWHNNYIFLSLWVVITLIISIICFKNDDDLGFVSVIGSLVLLGIVSLFKYGGSSDVPFNPLKASKIEMFVLDTCNKMNVGNPYYRDLNLSNSQKFCNYIYMKELTDANDKRSYLDKDIKLFDDIKSDLYRLEVKYKQTYPDAYTISDVVYSLYGIKLFDNMEYKIIQDWKNSKQELPDNISKQLTKYKQDHNIKVTDDEEKSGIWIVSQDIVDLNLKCKYPMDFKFGDKFSTEESRDVIMYVYSCIKETNK